LFIDNIIVKDNINILNNSIKKSSGTNGSVLISNDFEIEKNQRITYFTKDYCEQIDLS
jgi:dynactin complex subunit